MTVNDDLEHSLLYPFDAAKRDRLPGHMVSTSSSRELLLG